MVFDIFHSQALFALIDICTRTCRDVGNHSNFKKIWHMEIRQKERDGDEIKGRKENGKFKKNVLKNHFSSVQMIDYSILKNA